MLIWSVLLLQILPGIIQASLWDGAASILTRSGSSQPNPIPAAPTQNSDVTVQTAAGRIAKTIALLLQSAIQLDDVLAQQYCLSLPNARPWETACGLWRSKTPLLIECQVDGIRSLNGSGYINCYASMDVAGTVQRGRFARYYAVVTGPEEPSEGKMSRLRDFQRFLQNYAQKGRELLHPIIVMFEQCSYGRRLFSPFHPEASMFSGYFRDIDGHQKGFTATLTPAVPASGSNKGPLDIFMNFVASNPPLFYRMLADPQFALPVSKMPPVHPTALASVPDHVIEYCQEVKVFLAQLCRPVKEPVWMSLTNAEIEKAGMSDLSAIKKLHQPILDLLSSAISRDPDVHFLDCSSPLPYLTGSPFCPPSKEFIGKGLFARVAHSEAIPGLWIAIRGQNWVESSGAALGSYLKKILYNK